MIIRLWQAEGDQGDAPANRLLPVAGGEVTVGRPQESPYYGWDSEYGAQTFTLEPFAISQYLVSNGEFRAFVEDNGYSEQRWWNDEGWPLEALRTGQHAPLLAADG